MDQPETFEETGAQLPPPRTVVAARLDRGYPGVRKRFELIRDLLGAQSQVDFGRMLGVLSCFARVRRR